MVVRRLASAVIEAVDIGVEGLRKAVDCPEEQERRGNLSLIACSTVANVKSSGGKSELVSQRIHRNASAGFRLRTCQKMSSSGISSGRR